MQDLELNQKLQTFMLGELRERSAPCPRYNDKVQAVTTLPLKPLPSSAWDCVLVIDHSRLVRSLRNATGHSERQEHRE